MELFYSMWPTALTALSKAEYRTQNHPWICFFHGLGGVGKLWRPISSQIENKFNILAPDQRGHGQSIPANPENEDYTALQCAADLENTIPDSICPNMWLVGHSMGVRTASARAHLKPNLTNGLVLIDLGLSGPAGGGIGTVLRTFLDRLPEKFSNRSEARIFLEAHCPDPAIVQYLLAVLEKNSRDETVGFPFSRSALIKTIDQAPLSHTDEWAWEFAKSGGPILFLRGEKSGVWSKSDFEKTKEKFLVFPHVEFDEFNGAGHGLPFEKRLEFVSRLTEFIAKYSE